MKVRAFPFPVAGLLLISMEGFALPVMIAPEPQSNHAAGTIVSGPDGYLSVSLGDGGGAYDVGVGYVEDWYEQNRGGNAQNISADLLGKIIRINVDSRSEQDYGSGN